MKSYPDILSASQKAILESMPRGLSDYPPEEIKELTEGKNKKQTRKILNALERNDRQKQQTLRKMMNQAAKTARQAAHKENVTERTRVTQEGRTNRRQSLDERVKSVKEDFFQSHEIAYAHGQTPASALKAMAWANTVGSLGNAALGMAGNLGAAKIGAGSIGTNGLSNGGDLFTEAINEMPDNNRGGDSFGSNTNNNPESLGTGFSLPAWSKPAGLALVFLGIVATIYKVVFGNNPKPKKRKR